MDPFRFLASFPRVPTWLEVPHTGAVRAILDTEIVQLEANACSADDWARVLVPDDFNPNRVQRVHFSGDVVLGRFYTTVDRSGVALKSGVFDATLADCLIEDGARVSNVSLMAGTVVGPGALVADCDEVIAIRDCTFGNGVRVGLNAANADRSIPVVADLLFEDLARLVRPRPDAEVLAALEGVVAGYLDACRMSRTVISAGARVSGCRRVSGTFVGPGCVVISAETVTGTTLLPGARIGAGAIVRNALLQWNAVAEDGAFVEDSLLAEASSVTRKGIVTHSAIGPNTSIAEGEVSASVVGPFTGFNHHALLVSACWPEGRGNVGYGANVGSNHTGRAPDQEVHPGEGTFFGLGINVKMPADFSAAPYTIVATGVDTAPQRMTMPFSLIVPGSAPDGPNRLFPGWGLARNMYGIMRNVWKFSTRNRATRGLIDPDAFRPEIMVQIDLALRALEGLPEQAQYSGHDLRGFGANLVDHRDLESGRSAYQTTLRWYGLREFCRMWESGGRAPHPEQVPYLTRFATATEPGTLLDLYLAAERDRLAAVLTSKARDDHRGAKTIEDYAQVHTPAGDDYVYRWAEEQFEAISERIEGLRATI
ncbi:MAG: DUF4954 family protein [Rhodothermales bacterium]|nr:DUF4954 family protein [Rhodothermales bacterium]MBO6779913.1 DUF4954 family protein [Rhodothermales bacterium]